SEDVLRSLTVSKIKLAVCGIVVAAALGFGLRHRPSSALQAGFQNQPAAETSWREHAGQAQVDVAERKFKIRTRASSSWDEHTPDHAFDGKHHTMWNAGDWAPHWIEADLGALTQLARIRLTAAQLPAGSTVHELWASTEPIGRNLASAKRIHTFRG